MTGPGPTDVRIRVAVPADLAPLEEVFGQPSLSNEDDRTSLLAHPGVLGVDCPR
jgi:hypothetical protein